MGKKHSQQICGLPLLHGKCDSASSDKLLSHFFHCFFTYGHLLKDGPLVGDYPTPNILHHFQGIPQLNHLPSCQMNSLALLPFGLPNYCFNSPVQSSVWMVPVEVFQ